MADPIETASALAERLAAIEADHPPLAQHLGLRMVSADPDLAVAELEVRPELGNRNGVLHGGALMAAADTLGGTATFLNLPEGVGTTTIESKTNFFAAIRMGETVRAECRPLHRGGTTMVWQTTFIRADGKVAAVVTQTQLVLKGH